MEKTTKRSARIIPSRLGIHLEQVEPGIFRDKDGGVSLYKKAPNGDFIPYR